MINYSNLFFHAFLGFLTLVEALLLLLIFRFWILKKGNSLYVWPFVFLISVLIYVLQYEFGWACINALFCTAAVHNLYNTEKNKQGD